MKPLFLTQKEAQSTNKSFGTPNENKSKVSASNVESLSEEVQKSSLGARATDSARVVKFTKVLSDGCIRYYKLSISIFFTSLMTASSLLFSTLVEV